MPPTLESLSSSSWACWPLVARTNLTSSESWLLDASKNSRLRLRGYAIAFLFLFFFPFGEGIAMHEGEELVQSGVDLKQSELLLKFLNFILVCMVQTRVGDQVSFDWERLVSQVLNKTSLSKCSFVNQSGDRCCYVLNVSKDGYNDTQKLSCFCLFKIKTLMWSLSWVGLESNSRNFFLLWNK